MDKDGELLWQKSFGGKYSDVLKQSVALADGRFILAGNSNSPVSGNKNIENKGKSDWWIIKVDHDGKLIWQKSFGDDADDKLTTMILTKDHNILLGGSHTYIDKTSKQNKADIVLRKIDTNGQLLWQETYDNNGDDFLTNLLENKDGSLILGAYSASHSGNKMLKGKAKEDFLMIKTNSNGEEKWRRNIGGIKKEVLQKIISTRDDGYVLMGSSISKGKIGDKNSDFLIVKIADKDKPKHLKLPLEAVPNPAVVYTQAVIGKSYKEGKIEMYDMNGKLLFAQELKGSRIVPIPVTQYPDGVYIISVWADEMQNSVKFIRAKH